MVDLEIKILLIKENSVMLHINNDLTIELGPEDRLFHEEFAQTGISVSLSDGSHKYYKLSSQKEENNDY